MGVSFNFWIIQFRLDLYKLCLSKGVTRVFHLKFFFAKMVHTYHPNSKKKFSLQTINFFLIFDQTAYVHQT